MILLTTLDSPWLLPFQHRTCTVHLEVYTTAVQAAYMEAAAFTADQPGVYTDLLAVCTDQEAFTEEACTVEASMTCASTLTTQVSVKNSPAKTESSA